MNNQKDPSTAGHDAQRPKEIPSKGWKAIFARVKRQIKSDHLQLASAGVAFYFFLALFPAVSAVISIYGLFVDPAQAQAQIEQFAAVLPQQAQDVVAQIGQHVSGKSSQALGWGLVVSVLLSLWSANKGTKGLFEGINIAYDEEDDRGFFKKNGITLLYTLTVVVLGLAAIALVAAFPALVGQLGLSDTVTSALAILRWPVAALIAAFLIAYAYRAAPDRDNPQWKWISWGSVVALALWLGGSVLFSLYVANFGSFGSTYGSFAAIIILMLWFFLTAFFILLGAEINSEMEHQTAADTTKGPAQPMGQRGAYHADHAAGQPERGDPRRPH